MDKKINILHIIDNLEVGGAQEVLYHYARAIDASRFSMEIYALAGANAYASIPAVPARIICSNKYFLWLIVGRLFRLFASRKYDIVHLHLYYSKLLGRILIGLFFRGKIKVIIHDHNAMDTEFGRSLLYPLLQWVEKQLYRNTDAVVCCSEYVRNFDLTTFGYNPKNCVTIYNCIKASEGMDSAQNEHETLKALRAQTQGILFGVLARLHHEKGIDYLVRAFADFAKLQPIEKRPTLCIAGDGPQRKYLQHLAQKLNIDNQVIFLGFLASEYKHAFFTTIDCLIVPSVQESFSLVAVEALSHGVPVIASRVGGIIEVLGNGKYGFLFDRNQPDALKNTLVSFTQTFETKKEELDQQMLEAYRFIMQNFSVDKVIKKLEDCYVNVYNAGLIRLRSE